MDATWRQPGARPRGGHGRSPDTYWRPGALNEERSYWEVRYPEAIGLGNTVDLALLNRGTKTPTTIPLEITTANGTTTVDARDFCRAADAADRVGADRLPAWHWPTSSGRRCWESARSASPGEA